MTGVDTSLGVTVGQFAEKGAKGSSLPKSKPSAAEEEDRFMMIIKEMKEDREE